MIAIYALSCIDCPNDIYVGSSKDVEYRMKKHKSACNNVKEKNRYNLKVYQFIREHGGWEKWQYHIIEEFDVYDKKELKKREDYWMLELNSTLNSCRANHSKRDYYITHREAKIAETKKYRDENIVKLRTDNYCECGGRYKFENRHGHFKSKRCTKYMASILSI